MVKRNDNGVFADLFGIAAALPWWLGCTLAVTAYLLLHWYASVQPATHVPSAQIGQMVAHQFFRMLAFYGQFIIPLPFLAGAAASFFARRKRAGLFRDAAGDNSGESVRTLNWQDFELLVGEAFRMQGFAVAETGGGGADGGVDLQLTNGGEIFLVQCKQWRASKVSVNVVRELYGVMASEGATGGFVVTSGVFTADARAFAQGKNVELIDGAALYEMIERAAATRPGAVSMASMAEAPDRAEPEFQTASTIDPACPRCGAAMMMRIAKRGSSAGTAFWGCTAFPKCRGIRAIE